MKRPVTVGAVLAGGRSSRMGAPKALVELGSRPLVSRVVGTVGSAGLDPVVVAKPHTPLPKLDCKVLTEPTEPHHPLTGLICALRASAGRAIVVIACDMPLVPSKLLTWLANLEEPVAVCERNGQLEPLLGRYSPETADRLAEALDRGQPMRAAIGALDPFVIAEDRVARFGDPERIFFNINSPEDLAKAEGMLAGSDGHRPRSLRRRRGRGDSPATARS